MQIPFRLVVMTMSRKEVFRDIFWFVTSLLIGAASPEVKELMEQHAVGFG